MSIAITLLTVLLLFVCLLMVLIILMQRPKQEGLGAAFGGGMTDQMFGAQTTNVLQKGTVYFAVFYFVACAAIAILVSNKQEQSEASKALIETAAPAVEAAAPEEVPALDITPAEESAPPAAGAGETETPAAPEAIEIPAAVEPAPEPAAPAKTE